MCLRVNTPSEGTTIWVSLKIEHASNFPVLCHFFLRLNVHVKLYYPYSGESQSIYLTPLPHHFFLAILSPRLGMTDDFLASHKVAVEEVELWTDLSSGCDLSLLVDIYIYRYYICIGLYYIILSTIRGLSWIITIQLILIVGNQEDPIITSHFLEGRQRLSNSVLGSRRTEWSFSSLGTPSN